MSFYEINRKILNKNQGGQIYRYMSNAEERISVFLWQDPEKKDKYYHRINKFQITYDNKSIEWCRNDKELKYADIDEGDNPMKVKKSPLMIMSENIPSGLIDLISEIIKKAEKDKFPEFSFLLKHLKKKI